MKQRVERAARLWRTPLSPAQLDDKLLAALFKLTRTEQQVALRLALGQDAAEIALALNIQANTVRSHIKQLLSKSDTRRQAEFVVRVWHAVGRSSGAIQQTPHPGGQHADCAERYPDG